MHFRGGTPRPLCAHAFPCIKVAEDQACLNLLLKIRNPAPENFRRGQDELRKQRGTEALGFVDQRDGLCSVLGKDEALNLPQGGIDLPKFDGAGPGQLVTLAAVECGGGR